MEQQLKQRLIGVTVIVALVVIFVPMLFEQSGDRGVATPDGIPPLPDEVVERKPIELPKSAEDMAPKETETVPESGYKIIPLTDEAPAAGEQKGKTREVSAGTEVSGEPEEAPVEEDDIPVSEEKAADETRETPAPKAARVEKKSLGQEAKKQKPLSPPAQLSTQPKKTEPAPARLEKTVPAKPVAPAVALKSDTVPNTPKRTAKTFPGEAATTKPQEPSSTAPSKAAGEAVPTAWVVQTGSFTVEAKAIALTEKLRQSKYPAFVERVQGDSGVMYRVKVGPELDRGRAEQVQKQIEGNVGIKGIIVPQR